MAAITQFKNEQLAIIGVASIFLLVFFLRRSGPTVSAEYLIERTFELDEIRAYKTTQHAWNLAKAFQVSAPDYSYANIRKGANVFKAWKGVAPNAMLPGSEVTETKDPAKKQEITDLKSH